MNILRSRLGNCLGHPTNFVNAENTLMVFSVINSSIVFFIYFCSAIFFLKNFRKSVYVAFVKGLLEAYLFFGGVRALDGGDNDFRWRKERRR